MNILSLPLTLEERERLAYIFHSPVQPLLASLIKDHEEEREHISNDMADVSGRISEAIDDLVRAFEKSRWEFSSIVDETQRKLDAALDEFRTTIEKEA